MKVEVTGVVGADGTLTVGDKVPLPPGKVRVMVEPVPAVHLPPDDPFWRLMLDIWAGQDARGHVPRSAEEVDQQVREGRDGWDERQREIERLQEEHQRAREAG